MAHLLLPYTILTQGIYAGIIGTISTVTMGTCRLVTSIYNHRNPDISRVIKKLDIDRRLMLIQAVLNSIEHTAKHNEARLKLNDLEKTQVFELVGAETDLSNDPIELCLIYLHETIQAIHDDLSAINNKVEYHTTKWFSSWRTLNITSLIDNLELNAGLLNARFEDLTKISMFLASRHIH